MQHTKVPVRTLTRAVHSRPAGGYQNMFERACGVKVDTGIRDADMWKE
jgi:hypothetical protein